MSLKNCTDFFCTSGNPKDVLDNCIKRPLESHGLAPFVRMKFLNMPGLANAKGTTSANGLPIIITVDTSIKPDLTVGNDSNPPNNRAVIKSFTYGSSDGNGAEVEIFDEEGGELDLFINKLVKVIDDANDYSCNIEWGWIVTDCYGKSEIGPRSYLHHFLILAVDIHYAAGGIIFKLELQDLMEPLFETRALDNFENMTLKSAITELFQKRSNPKVPSILFKKMTAGAGGINPCTTLVTAPVGGQSSSLKETLTDFKFKSPFEWGTPSSPWECKNQTPLAAVRDWLRNILTEDDKGTIIFWNSCSPVPELVILEDPLPKCWSNLEAEQCSRSIGTYIVNGGNSSPVISFNPQIKFTFAAAARAGGGQATESADGKPTKPPNPCPEDAPSMGGRGSGNTVYLSMTPPFTELAGADSLDLNSRGVIANQRANKTYENVEAELRIQGDPTLDNPYSIKVKTISLVVVNPFHLRSSNDKNTDCAMSGSFDGCPQWLVCPPCNQILSNKNWFIKGVSHEIKDGSFTTTLKLYLPAPGQTLSP